MPQPRFRLIKTYQEALELLIAYDVDGIIRAKNEDVSALSWALSRLEFVAQLFALRGADEVLKDMKEFRDQFPEEVTRLTNTFLIP